jgi:hypothetical protein
MDNVHGKCGRIFTGSHMLIGVKSAARVLPQWAEHVLFQQWLSGSHHVFRGREASSRHHGGQVRHSLSGGHELHW